jgi:hypothetical protein
VRGALSHNHPPKPGPHRQGQALRVRATLTPPAVVARLAVGSEKYMVVMSHQEACTRGLAVGIATTYPPGIFSERIVEVKRRVVMGYHRDAQLAISIGQGTRQIIHYRRMAKVL